MNINGSITPLIQVDQKNEEHNESEISKRINDLSELQSEYEYWQNKVMEKNLQLLNDTIAFSKKKDEVRSRLDRSATENSDLINKIKNLEISVSNNKRMIEENSSNLSEISNKVPIIEAENIEIYNDYIQKSNYIKSLTVPEVMTNHLLNFDQRVLQNLTIKLHNILNNKMHEQHYVYQQNMMMMNQQQNSNNSNSSNNNNYMNHTQNSNNNPTPNNNSFIGFNGSSNLSKSMNDIDNENGRSYEGWNGNNDSS